MVCLTGIFRCSHNAGEESDQDDANRGKAGADYANVDFDIRPVDDFDLVPGWVRGGGKANEGLETEAGYDRNARLY